MLQWLSVVIVVKFLGSGYIYRLKKQIQIYTKGKQDVGIVKLNFQPQRI